MKNTADAYIKKELEKTKLSDAEKRFAESIAHIALAKINKRLNLQVS